jgi:hypothetical protein
MGHEAPSPAIQRQALLVPYMLAAITFMGWTAAGLVWAVLWPALTETMRWAVAFRSMFGITVSRVGRRDHLVPHRRAPVAARPAALLREGGSLPRAGRAAPPRPGAAPARVRDGERAAAGRAGLVLTRGRWRWWGRRR